MAKSPPASPQTVPAAGPVPAGFVVRLAALVYDALLLLAVNAVLGAIIVTIGTPSQAAAQHQIAVLPDWYRYGVQMPAHLAITWLFYIHFWRKVGHTLGMQTWHLKVVRHDGALLTWGDGIARMAWASLLPFLCGGISALLHGSNASIMISLGLGLLGNYLWMFCNARRLTWHDQLSRTVVLRMPPPPKSEKKRLGFFSTDE